MDERHDSKRQALREHGVLNARANEVKDPLYLSSDNGTTWDTRLSS